MKNQTWKIVFKEYLHKKGRIISHVFPTHPRLLSQHTHLTHNTPILSFLLKSLIIIIHRWNNITSCRHNKRIFWGWHRYHRHPHTRTHGWLCVDLEDIRRRKKKRLYIILLKLLNWNATYVHTIDYSLPPSSWTSTDDKILWDNLPAYYRRKKWHSDILSPWFDGEHNEKLDKLLQCLISLFLVSLRLEQQPGLMRMHGFPTEKK